MKAAAAPEAGELSPAMAAVRQAAAEPSLLARWWLYLKLLFQRFGRDQCTVFAAALSFFGLVSIGPALLLGLAALGYAVHDPGQALERLIAHVLPGGQAQDLARSLIDQFQVRQKLDALTGARGPAAIVGALSLIWASMQIFVSSAAAMNAAYEAQETRSWLQQRLVALGLLFGAGALFLLSLLPSSGPDLIRHLHIPSMGLPERVPAYVQLLFALAGVAINAAMFTLIYRFLPAAQVTWKEAAVGGVFMGMLWEAAKEGFSFYLGHFGKNPAYTAFGGSVLLVFWIYYSAALLLLGAEVAKLYRDTLSA